jgi:hypothetical protein
VAARPSAADTMGMPAMSAHTGKFYWANGRVERHPVADPTADEIPMPGPDRRWHSFKATDEIEDGCDVYRESD